MTGNENALSLQSQDLNVLQRIINVFVAPAATFKAVRLRPKWLTPFLIILVLTLGITHFLKPVAQQVQRKAMIEQLEKQGMSESQIDSQVENLQSMMKIWMYPSALLATAFMLFAGALIWLFISNTIIGSDVNFGQMMGVNCYRYLILLLGSLIKLPIMLSQNTINVHFSLATFMSDEAQNTFIYKFLSNVELFNIWSIAVLCIGLAVVARVKVDKIWPWAALLFLIYYAGAAGIGTAFGR